MLEGKLTILMYSDASDVIRIMLQLFVSNIFSILSLCLFAPLLRPARLSEPVFLTSYLMLGLQLAAKYLEDPFGYDLSDLELDQVRNGALLAVTFSFVFFTVRCGRFCFCYTPPPCGSFGWWLVCARRNAGLIEIVLAGGCVVWPTSFLSCRLELDSVSSAPQWMWSYFSTSHRVFFVDSFSFTMFYLHAFLWCFFFKTWCFVVALLEGSLSAAATATRLHTFI